MTPFTIQFHSHPATEVLRLTKDGIWANPDIPADDAAKLVLEAIDHNIKILVQKAVLAEREAFNKELQQYADWLDEAAADIEDWGMYASEYLQQKWDLPDQVQDYKNRAASIRARGNA